MTISGLCHCNPQMSTDGSWSHAVNCPLRPTVIQMNTVNLTTEKSEWQKGYDAGYAAGLAASRAQRGSLW